MATKRRSKYKKVDETLPAPGERQLARLPDWWQSTDQAELERAHCRGGQLIEGGVGSLSWDELTGQR